MKRYLVRSRTVGVIEFALAIIVASALSSCARAPIKSVDQAMRPAETPQILLDDLGLLDLAEALKADIARIKTFGNPIGIMRFGSIEISKELYIQGLERLIEALNVDPSGALFTKTLRTEFDFLEVYGGESGWGDVFVTSYFEPVIKGSLTSKKPYTQALYGIPQDMVSVNMGEFARVFPALQPYQETVIEQKSRDGFLRGRLIRNNDKSISSVIPYFTRKEIDEEKKIVNVAPVLCYVDPVDAFFLQIQGSGRVEISPENVIKVGYAAQNGHGYKAIGKLLFDVIPKEKMSAQKIDSHLRGLTPQAAQKIMNYNESYVFFQKQETEPLSYFGAEVVPGRTIATDQKYFPKGALAFLEYEKPKVESEVLPDVVEFVKSSRFVLDQDTGGAIRGPHRVDLFWGRGHEAAQISGVMRNPGRLYYILPKKRAL